MSLENLQLLLGLAMATDSKILSEKFLFACIQHRVAVDLDHLLNG